MNLLFFDTETIGLPGNWRAHWSNLNNWPRMMSIAWVLTDDTGTIKDQQSHMISPEGWVVPVAEFWTKHGYSTERSMAEGRPIKEILVDHFIPHVATCDFLISHNVAFDLNILYAEIMRLGIIPRKDIRTLCTMQIGTNYCRIPGSYGKFKWPTLEELHRRLFGKSVEGAHDALADVIACKNCFFGLLEKQIIKL